MEFYGGLEGPGFLVLFVEPKGGEAGSVDHEVCEEVVGIGQFGMRGRVGCRHLVPEALGAAHAPFGLDHLLDAQHFLSGLRLVLRDGLIAKMLVLAALEGLFRDQKGFGAATVAVRIAG